LRTILGRCWSIIFCIPSGPAALRGLRWRTIQAISEGFVVLLRSVSGCSRTSVPTVKLRSASEFVVKTCSKVSENAFTFSWISVTVFPLIVRGVILLRVSHN
jgi:hypothetical protein